MDASDARTPGFPPDSTFFAPLPGAKTAMSDSPVRRPLTTDRFVEFPTLQSLLESKSEAEAFGTPSAVHVVN